MNEALTRNLVTIFHPTAKYLDKLRLRKKIPYFCIITPVFDPALDSLRSLIKDLRKQNFPDYTHIIISNGASKKVEDFFIKNWIEDKRIVYDQIPFEELTSGEELIINLGKRRNYCLKKYPARRYLFLDADLKLTDESFLSKVFLADKLTRKDIIITKTKVNKEILPKFPLDIGRLDISNYSFSQKIAQKYDYPTSFDPKTGWGNDYPFFLKIFKAESSIFLDFIAAEKDVSRSYKRTSDIFLESNLIEKISVFGNRFQDDDIEAVSGVLASHLVGVGKITEDFEKRFSKKLGLPYAVATNSCTNSFWLLLKALNIQNSDEIIIPNIHFIGIKNVLDLLNVKYKIADVGEEIPNLTVETIKEKITSNTKAIIFLEYGGYPVEIDQIKAFLRKVKREDIQLIIDASNSPFTKRNGKYTVVSYDFSVFSFDMNKIIVTGDGGMILSENKAIMGRVRKLAFYGLAEAGKSAFEKSQSEDEWWEVKVEEPSLKMAMNNLSASLGITQLEKVDSFLKERENLRENYLKKLGNLVERGLISLPAKPRQVENCLYLFWIKVKNKETRNDLSRFLLSKKIYTTVKYQPLSLNAATPNAYDFYDRSLCLPFNQNLHYSLLEYIVSQIYDFFEKNGQG